MKRMKEKFNRIVKYWRVTYRQASGRDRLIMGMLMLMVLVYTWWMILML